MLRPAMNDMLGENRDSYAFVVAVAKRARELADETEETHEILEGKPVRMSVDEFSNGKCKLYHTEHVVHEDHRETIDYLEEL